MSTTERSATEPSPMARRLNLLAQHRGEVALVLATIVANVSNFVFHVMVSRLLGPGSYSGLSALLVLLTVVAVPLSALQLTTAQAQAGFNADSDIRGVVKGTLAAGAAIFVVAAVATPFVAGFFHLGSPIAVLMGDAWLLLAVIGAVPYGVLLGQRRYGAIALALLVGTVGVRLATGEGLATLGGISGGMFATVLGQGATTALTFVAVRRQLFSPTGPRLRLDWTDGLLSVFALIGFALLAGIDTMIARHVMTPLQSGYYAAAAIAGRIALFAPASVALIAFPRFVEAKKRSSNDLKVLSASLGLTVSVGLLAAGLLAAAPSIAVRLLFGSRYALAAHEVPLLALEGAALGGLSVLIYYHIARRSGTSLIAWPGALLVAVLAFIWRPGPEGLAFLMVVISLTVVVLALVRLGLAQIGFRTADSHLRASVRLPSPSEATEKALTLVVPYYNPGPALRPHVEGLVETLDKIGLSYEIIPVADGCTDGSDHLLDGLRPDVIHPVVLTANQGKGEALRVGLVHGEGRYLGFIDADGDLQADLLPAFVGVVTATQPHLAVGSKRHPGSFVEYPPIRRAYSWGYQQFVRLMFGLDVRDTQTGLKIIRRDVLADVLPRTLEKRYAFDLELLVVARRLGYRNIIELPVKVTHRFGSTVSGGAVWKILQDTLAIYYRLRLLRYYDADPGLRSDDLTVSPTGTPNLGDAVAV